MQNLDQCSVSRRFVLTGSVSSFHYFSPQCITVMYPGTELNEFASEINKLKVLEKIHHIFFFSLPLD